MLLALVDGYAANRYHRTCRKINDNKLLLKTVQHARCTPSKVRVASLSPSLATLSGSQNSSNEPFLIRSRLRQVTGFSLTAVLSTLRAASGVSLSAVYASTVALSGAWIRQTMKAVLAFFPAWMRYFVQPILVLYYVPLFLVRSLVGPNRQIAKHSHEHLLDFWKNAVEVADGSHSYWPVHVNAKGELESDMKELDLNQAIAESSFAFLEVQEKSIQKLGDDVNGNGSFLPTQ